MQTLDNNHVRSQFCQAVYRALAEGRKKKTNVMLLGPTNAAKSFLVKPLAQIYRAYKIPDSGNYQLESILDKEIVFLNDFAWDPRETWMRWAYFKDFLEGGGVNVGRPKNRGGDVWFAKDIPVIGTSPHRIELQVRDGRRVAVDAIETSQMDSRWEYINLSVSVPGDFVVECGPCSRCAAEVYLLGKPV